MDWKSVASKVANAAPLVGTILGGPIGLAVGTVGKLAASALGVDSTPEAVDSALSSDPAALEKLKELEINAKVQLQQILATQQQNELANNLAMYQAEGSDRADARKRQVDMKDRFTDVLACVITVGFFASLFGLFFASVPEGNKAVVYVVVGSLGTAFAAVVAYYFGSTRNSSQQQQKITDFAMAPGAVTLDSKASS